MGLVSDEGKGMAASVVEPVPSNLPATYDKTNPSSQHACGQGTTDRSEDKVNANDLHTYCNQCQHQQRTPVNGNVVQCSDTTCCHKMSASDSNSNHQSKDIQVDVHTELVNNNNTKVSAPVLCTEGGCTPRPEAPRSQDDCDDFPSKLACTPPPHSDSHQSKTGQTSGGHDDNTIQPSSLNAPKVKVHSAPSSPVKSSTTSSATDSSLLSPRTRRRRFKRKPTVLGVTAEAGHVLDEFLSRSLSQNDVSPLHPKELHHLPSSDTPTPERRDTLDSVDELDGIPEHPTSGYEESMEIKSASDEYILDDDQTTYSPTSDCSRSSSLKHRLNVRKLTEQDVADALAKKGTKKTKKARLRKASTSSSTSEEDKRGHKTQERKKKSVFRKTTERLRESFRRLKQKPQAHKLAEDKQSPSDEKKSPPKSALKKRYSIRSRFSFKSKSKGDKSSPAVTPGEHTEHYVHKYSEDITIHGATSRHVVSDIEELNITRRNSPRMSDGDHEKKSRSTRSVFETVLYQLRKKVRQKSTKEVPESESSPPGHHRSKSADAAAFERTHQWGGGEGQAVKSSRQRGSQSVQELPGWPPAIQRPTAPELPPLRPLRDGLSSEALHELRRRQRLEGLRVCQPSARFDDEVDFAAPTPVGATATTEADGLDEDIPDGLPGEPMTHQEREVMYERVADQLAQIADNYELLSPSPDGANSGAVGPQTSLFSFESLLGSALREKGDKLAENMTDMQPVVSAMTRHISYHSFKTILSDHLGQEPGWQQVAMMFRLTRSAVSLVGRGTQAALSIKDMTLKYFEDQFAGWVVSQGGWESMVETDLSSEVD